MIKKPFQNETESDAIDELTIENRLDRVSIYGSLEITADGAGRKKVTALQLLLNRVMSELLKKDAAGELPEKIVLDATTPVANPFE